MKTKDDYQKTKSNDNDICALPGTDTGVLQIAIIVIIVAAVIVGFTFLVVWGISLIINVL